MSVTDVSNVSRETGDTPVSRGSGQRDRRSAPRAKVRHADGALRRTGSAYTPEEVDTLRRLIAAHCTDRDIATHFGVTVPAIKMLCQRHAIKRTRPTVAEVLRSGAGCADPRTLPLPAASEVSDQAHDPELPHPEPVEGRGATIPTVILVDRFEKYDGKVELHEVDARGMARIKRAMGEGAGKWLTVPVLQLRFARDQDRAILIAQAKERAAATAARRAALSTPHPEPVEGRNQGATDNA